MLYLNAMRHLYDDVVWHDTIIDILFELAWLKILANFAA